MPRGRMRRRKCQTQPEPSCTACSWYHSAMLGSANSGCPRKSLQSWTTHTEQQTMTTMTHLQHLEQVERLPCLQQLLPWHAATQAALSWHAAYCWWQSLLHWWQADSTTKSSGLETTSQACKTRQSIRIMWFPINFLCYLIPWPQVRVVQLDQVRKNAPNATSSSLLLLKRKKQLYSHQKNPVFQVLFLFLLSFCSRRAA